MTKKSRSRFTSLNSCVSLLIETSPGTSGPKLKLPGFLSPLSPSVLPSAPFSLASSPGAAAASLLSFPVVVTSSPVAFSSFFAFSPSSFDTSAAAGLFFVLSDFGPLFVFAFAVDIALSANVSGSALSRPPIMFILCCFRCFRLNRFTSIYFCFK